MLQSNDIRPTSLEHSTGGSEQGMFELNSGICDCSHRRSDIQRSMNHKVKQPMQKYNFRFIVQCGLSRKKMPTMQNQTVNHPVEAVSYHISCKHEIERRSHGFRGCTPFKPLNLHDTHACILDVLDVVLIVACIPVSSSCLPINKSSGLSVFHRVN